MRQPFIHCIACLFFLMAVLPVRSQILLSLLFGDKLNSDEMAFGIHLNYSWNNISNISPSSTLTKLNLGLFLTYKLNNRWHINTEPLAKYTRGAKKLAPYPVNDSVLDSIFNTTTVTRSIHYFALPVTVRYLFIDNLFAETGPQIALRLKANDEFEAPTDAGSLILKRDIKSGVSGWDLTWLFGAGAAVGKSKTLTTGVRYAYGLSDVMKKTDHNQGHRAFYIYANVPIGRTKSQQ